MRVTVVSYFIFAIFCSLRCAFALGNDTILSRNVSQGKESENRVSTITAKSSKRANSDSKVLAKSSESSLQRKWVTQVFVEAADLFDMDVNVSAACKRDFEFYKKHLQNQTVWAVRMLESSQWPSVGIFSGMLDHLGNYDECLWVSSHGIKGQYCLAQAIYDYDVDDTSARQISGALDFADETKSAWNALKMYLKNPVRVNRHKLTWAVCVPSSCKANDVNGSLNSLLSPLFRKYGMNISVNVDPIMCKKKEASSYTAGYYIVSILYGVIFAVVICSTIYEISMSEYLKRVKNKSAFLEIFRCFSLRKNWRKLMKYDKNKDYAALHLIKVVNIMFIIYGHRYIYFIGFPKFSAETIEMFYRASSIELVHTNVVDVFFMVSGFLTFYFGVRPMMKGGVMYLVLSVVFRWIRMVPVFVLLMLFIINILPYLNDAPLWDYRIHNEVENCRASWWRNLLAISNIVNTDKQCLLISWYISADIQLTVIGSILLLLICKNRTFGTVVMVLTFIAGIGTTFAVAYANKYYGLLRLYVDLLEEPRNSAEFTKFYVSTYSRLGPYLVGFISAFISHVLKERMFVFSVRRMWFFSIASIIVGEGSQYYGCLFYLFGREYDRFESASYAALNRSLFAFPFAVMLCMYFTSGLSKFGEAIQRRFLVTLGRLTYSVFLVNTLLQLYHASSQKSVMPTSIVMNLYWWAASDIIFSYFFGMLLHLFAEAPVCNLSKIIQQGILKMIMKPRKLSEEIVSGAASDTTDKTSEESAEKGKLKGTQESKNEEKSCNGCVNRSFETSESFPANELVANETISSRC